MKMMSWWLLNLQIYKFGHWLEKKNFYFTISSKSMLKKFLPIDDHKY